MMWIKRQDDSRRWTVEYAAADGRREGSFGSPKFDIPIERHDNPRFQQMSLCGRKGLLSQG